MTCTFSAYSRPTYIHQPDTFSDAQEQHSRCYPNLKSGKDKAFQIPRRIMSYRLLYLVIILNNSAYAQLPRSL